ncbi:MAG: TMEM165/GDT1 family protein [Kiritimatiellae bacterium]|nr:TMEM165/GDT1 family protein [Kiritimatiellia bacterium]
MDWKTTLATFSMIFLAEMGDKTQLAVFNFAAKSQAPLAVFIGGGAALLLTTLLGVLFGGAIARAIPAHVVRYAAGSLFIAFGIWTLLGR